eukprot:COSAG01_NODE_18720_length_1057_cov_167.760960_2_plen_116_part_00
MWGSQPSPKSRGWGLATERPSRPRPYWRNHTAAGYPRAPRPLGSRHVKYAGGLALAALFVTNCGGTNATNSWNYLVKGPYLVGTRDSESSRVREPGNFCESYLFMQYWHEQQPNP